MKVGAMDYVQKPFTEDELLAFVKKTLIRRQDRIARLLKPSVHVTHLPEADRVRRGEFSIPGGVFISTGHTWVSLSQEGAAKVGMDDFAKKLIGQVDAVEFPPIGMTVKVGQPLFVVKQKKRRVQFTSPISGRVVKTNAALAEDTEPLELTPYQKNWICMIDAEKLDVEVPQLKIGKAAVALFEEDIDKFRTAMKGMLGEAATGTEADDLIYRGELGQLSDDQSDRVAKEFFAR
jgi:glycine cleavage system H protein